MKQGNIIMVGAATFLLIFFTLLGTTSNTYPYQERLDRKVVERGYLGVSIKDVPEEVLEAYGWKDHRGVLITEVEKNSPADKAGLKEGDVIIEFNGRPVDDTDDLTRFVRRCEPGKQVKVNIMRQGKVQTINVTIGKLRRHLPMIGPGIIHPFTFYQYYPGIEPGIRPPVAPYRFFFGGRLGLQVQNLNPTLGEYFQRESGKGVLVLEVQEDSLAEEAGFQPGDVIIRINDEAVEDTEDLFDILREAEEGDKLTVEILRKGKSHKLTVEIEDDDHIIIIGEPKVKKIISIRHYPMECYRFEMDMSQLNRDLESLQERIHRQLRALDFDFIERVIERMEKKLQQAMEEVKRATERLEKKSVRLYQLGRVL